MKPIKAWMLTSLCDGKLQYGYIRPTRAQARNLLAWPDERVIPVEIRESKKAPAKRKEEK